jgi:hypothetical protein
MNSSKIDRRNCPGHSRARCAFLLIALCLLCFGLTPKVNAVDVANVTAVNYKPGSPSIDLIVAIKKGIDDAARTGNAPFNIECTLTYVSSTGTVETLDSGIVSIQNGTTFLSTIDNRTVSFTLTVPFGTHPQPGANPSYSATAQVSHTAGNGTEVQLGDAEQTFF